MAQEFVLVLLGAAHLCSSSHLAKISLMELVKKMCVRLEPSWNVKLFTSMYHLIKSIAA
jgi:hypothetical protein